MRSLLLCTLCTLFYSFGCLAQQQAGMELSTLRIGPFKMQMSKSEAAALAKTSLKKATNEKGWPVPNIVKYNGELIAVTIDDYYGTENTSKEVITEVSTTSTKFRTKSGMGLVQLAMNYLMHTKIMATLKYVLIGTQTLISVPRIRLILF